MKDREEWRERVRDIHAGGKCLIAKKKTWLLIDSSVPSNYVVPSISFQTFFVQAFNIIVDTLKLSMLLLFIL